MPFQARAPIQYFPLNTKGRDFIVGDVHGAFSLLLEALAAVNFDPAVDRLFSVGDLVDRGPESHLASNWVNGLKLHAVTGNHEFMALQAFDPDGNLRPASPRFMEALVRNGLGWWLKLTPAERVPHLQAFAKLPHVIEVETARGTVGIVHADVPLGMDWSEFKALIEAGDAETVEYSMWSTLRADNSIKVGVPGVGRVFVGHTIQWGGLQRLGNVYAVDTGGVHGSRGWKEPGALTVAELVCRTEILVAPKPRAFIHALEDFEPSEDPFGTGPAYIQPQAKAVGAGTALGS